MCLLINFVSNFKPISYSNVFIGSKVPLVRIIFLAPFFLSAKNAIFGVKQAKLIFFLFWGLFFSIINLKLLI